MSELSCFKAYDIRGEIGVNIEGGIAYRIGYAVAQHFGAQTIVIGFDALETSLAFAFGLAEDSTKHISVTTRLLSLKKWHG